MASFTYIITDLWSLDDHVKAYFEEIIQTYWPDARRDEKNPDICIYLPFGDDHVQYPNATKIAYSLEVNWPDLNYADYAMGFTYLDYPSRYMRLPYYALIDGYEDVRTDPAKSYLGLSDAQLLDRKFCNFIYSNRHDMPLRDRFFKRLSEYKRVDSGGRHLNNIGGPVGNKLMWLRNYKFTIAIENCASDGYVTEKMIDPMIAGSMPIYHGNPTVDRDFNMDSVIWVRDESDIERAVEEVVRLDRDDAAYLEKFRIPWMTSEQQTHDWYAEVVAFLERIIQLPPEQRKQRPDNNHMRSLQKTALRKYLILNLINPIYLALRKWLKIRGKWPT